MARSTKGRCTNCGPTSSTRWASSGRCAACEKHFVTYGNEKGPANMVDTAAGVQIINCKGMDIWPTMKQHYRDMTIANTEKVTVAVDQHGIISIQFPGYPGLSGKKLSKALNEDGVGPPVSLPGYQWCRGHWSDNLVIYWTPRAEDEDKNIAIKPSTTCAHCYKIKRKYEDSKKEERDINRADAKEQKISKLSEVPVLAVTHKQISIMQGLIKYFDDAKASGTAASARDMALKGASLFDSYQSVPGEAEARRRKMARIEAQVARIPDSLVQLQENPLSRREADEIYDETGEDECGQLL